MAKCSLCNKRKGKRKCFVTEAYICSLCCGKIRKKETCEGCVYYKDTKLTRRYRDVPKYLPQDIANNQELEDYAKVIESAICAFDNSITNQITDDIAITIIERLLDVFHFHDSSIEINDKILADGFNQVFNVIKSDLSDISDEEITKILGAIYFVARRRSEGHREYLDFIHQHIGDRIGPGIRFLKM